MEISENIVRLKKFVETALALTKVKEATDEEFLRYVDSFVEDRVKEAVKDLYPEIDKRHQLEPGSGDRVTAIHYTGIDVLVSMLEKVAAGNKDSLRMYDSVHLNDPAEGNYIATNIPKEYDCEWLEKKDTSHAYIASFVTPDCREEEEKASDNLVFWRTYGEEGQGCSLSFPLSRNRLRKVLYGSDEVRHTLEILKPVLDAVKPLADIPEPSLREETRKTLARAVWNSMERFNYLYKSRAYGYEKECRLVQPRADIKNEKNIRFEMQGGGNSPPHIRHYCEDECLLTEKLLVSGSRITLGPCVSYPDDTLRCLETILRKAGLDGPVVRTSGIDYRKP